MGIYAAHRSIDDREYVAKEERWLKEKPRHINEATIRQKLLRGYKSIAIFVFNLILLFSLLNGCMWIYGVFVPEKLAYPDPVSKKKMLPVYGLGSLRYEFAKIRQVYPSFMSDLQIIRLRLETSNVQRFFDADTFYREEPFDGLTELREVSLVECFFEARA